MAFDTISATLTQYISLDSKKTIKERIRKAQYGDGYMQKSKDGLNSTQDIWALIFAPLEGIDKTAMDSFLSTYGCDIVFLWTPPGETIPKKWSRVENTLDMQLLNVTQYIIKFTVEQRFDLG